MAELDHDRWVPVPEQVIGIDVGGTTIKLGRFSPTGQCLDTLTIDTPQPATPDAVLATIAAAIQQLDPSGLALAIGLGMPGYVDLEGRLSLMALNLWDRQSVPIADWLEQKLGKPVILANDANCAGLGETWLGAGRQCQQLVLLTLGTGVGGAVIMDGKLLLGSRGAGAELGLMTLYPDGLPCPSGNQGSLEQYVSAKGIRRRTGQEPRELDAKARAGDAAACQFWQDYGRDLGIGISSLIYIFDPERVILGGGLMASADLFMPAVHAEVKRRALHVALGGLQVVTAELGNQAGMVGAAKLAWQWQGRSGNL